MAAPKEMIQQERLVPVSYKQRLDVAQGDLLNQDKGGNATNLWRMFVSSQFRYYWLGLFSLTFTSLLVKSQWGSPNQSNLNESCNLSRTDSCHGKRIYMYPLPSKFNTLILEQCDRQMVDWLNFCPHVENQGFGLFLNNSNCSSWFGTDPYMLEVIFHARMQRYRCLTQSPLQADAFFIPYYSGLDSLRFIYGRDKGNASDQGKELVSWLEEEGGVTWKRRGGEDHFIVMGRTAWDFSRPLGVKEGWGTSFHVLPAMANVTALFLEKRPWTSSNEQAIPYPTSFHPPLYSSLQAWLESVRIHPRQFLFSFSGAPRSGPNSSIRQMVLSECRNSQLRCAFVDCQKVKCAHNPQPIIDSFLQSEFCLQPPGDTLTRRSTFDGLITGCIPVFFRNESAYTQYTWHLFNDPSTYSVFISEKDLQRGLRIQDYLATYSRERILRMRENIIQLIPGLVYLSPAAASEFEDTLSPISDAFTLSLEGLLRKIGERRRSWLLTDM